MSGGGPGAIDADPYEQAKEFGVEVVESDQWMLQIDLDVPPGESAPADYDDKTLRAREQIVDEYCVGEPLETRSRNGNQHIYFALKTAQDTRTRIALQLAMGSDPVREVLAMLRLVKSPKRPPMVLFEMPEEAARVRKFLHERWALAKESA